MSVDETVYTIFTVIATIGNTKTMPGFDADDNWVYILAKKSIRMGAVR